MQSPKHRDPNMLLIGQNCRERPGHQVVNGSLSGHDSTLWVRKAIIVLVTRCVGIVRTAADAACLTLLPSTPHIVRTDFASACTPSGSSAQPVIHSNAPWCADSRDQVVKRGEVWRLFSSMWPANSVAAAIVTGLLLYRFRTFERQMGSSRFSMFVFFATIWALGIRAALVFGGGPLTSSGLTSGPTELLCALFVYYYRELLVSILGCTAMALTILG